MFHASAVNTVRGGVFTDGHRVLTETLAEKLSIRSKRAFHAQLEVFKILGKHLKLFFFQTDIFLFAPAKINSGAVFG